MSDEEIDYLKCSSIVKESDPFDVKDEDWKIQAKITTPTVTTTTYELPRGHNRLIKVVVSFNQHRAQSGNQIMDDWSDVISQAFNQFRIHTYNNYVTSPKSSRFDSHKTHNHPTLHLLSQINSPKQNSFGNALNVIHQTLRYLRIKAVQVLVLLSYDNIIY